MTEPLEGRIILTRARDGGAVEVPHLHAVFEYESVADGDTRVVYNGFSWVVREGRDEIVAKIEAARQREMGHFSIHARRAIYGAEGEALTGVPYLNELFDWIRLEVYSMSMQDVASPEYAAFIKRILESVWTI